MERSNTKSQCVAVEPLEARRMLAARPHLTFVEAATEFAVLSSGADIRTAGSERGAIVARATAIGEQGQPLGILVANSNSAILVVPGGSR